MKKIYQIKQIDDYTSVISGGVACVATERAVYPHPRWVLLTVAIFSPFPTSWISVPTICVKEIVLIRDTIFSLPTYIVLHFFMFLLVRYLLCDIFRRASVIIFVLNWAEVPSESRHGFYLIEIGSKNNFPSSSSWEFVW